MQSHAPEKEADGLKMRIFPRKSAASFPLLTAARAVCIIYFAAQAALRIFLSLSLSLRAFRGLTIRAVIFPSQID